MKLTRKDLRARYWIFQEAVLDDQRKYYSRTVEIYEKAARGVRFWRALMALVAGAASLLVSLIILSASSSGALQACNAESLNEFSANTIEITASTQSMIEEVDCSPVRTHAPILIIIATVAPAIAAAFATLADLYQWDRLSSIYKNAYRSLAVPDALSPDDEMNDEVYLASLQAYAEGTLRVIRDETSQWGQSVKIPEALQEYISQAESRTRGSDE